MKEIKKYSPAKKFVWLLAIFIAASSFLFFARSSVLQAADKPADKVLQLDQTTSAKNEKSMDYITNPSLTTGSCSYLTSPIMCPLMDVLRLMAWLLGVAASIFYVAADATILREFLSGPQIYLVWSQIRDFLNIAFILVLLFSAFSTIFQVETYGYKKILKHLLLMALLVNFSYPIARFIIDLSNVLMYTIAQNLLPAGGTTGLFAIFSDRSNIGKILGADTTGSVTSLLVGIVFTFILAITLLSIALLFVIRMIALALVIMFSPVAFTATIVSGVDGGFASKWWSYLFKYSFFGPVMLFMLYISTQLMQATKGVSAALQTTASAQAGGLATIIWSMSTYSMPIIILWIGMGIAQSMGIEGAGAIMGQAQKFIKNTAKGGGMFAPATWGIKKTAGITGVSGALKNRWDYFKKTGITGTDAAEERAARYSAALGGDKNAYENMRLKRTKEAAEKHDMSNMNAAELNNLKRDGNQYEKAAASLALADKGKADATDLGALQTAGFNENSQVFKQLQSKIKTYNPTAAFAHIADANARKARIEDHINSNQFDASKLSAAALDGPQGEELLQLAFNNNAISTKDLETLRGKPAHDAALNTSLAALASNADNQDPTHPVNKKRNISIQMAHLTQTGAPLASVAGNADWQRELYSRANKETFKRTKLADMTPQVISGMAQNVSTGRYKEILMSMNNDARKVLNDHIGMGTWPPASNEAALQRIIFSDPYLNSL